MKTVRMNITIPEDIAQELRVIKNKSRFITDALRERMMEIKRKQLDDLLIAGYRETRLEDSKINGEWESATLESWK